MSREATAAGAQVDDRNAAAGRDVPGSAGTRTGERGAGTVLALAVVAGVVMLCGWLALLAQAQTTRGRAQIAADLGALAGATALRASVDACGVAGTAVEHNGARLTDCELLGDGQVRVRTVVTGSVGRAGAAARAGPASTRG